MNRLLAWSLDAGQLPGDRDLCHCLRYHRASSDCITAPGARRRAVAFAGRSRHAERLGLGLDRPAHNQRARAHPVQVVSIIEIDADLLWPPAPTARTAIGHYSLDGAVPV